MMKLKEFMNLPVPLWLWIVITLITLVNVESNKRQHFQDADDLNRRVTQLELRR